ncbi:cadherin-like beta sandwich domain-containing protein [Amedibacillus sp. YH-ame10]
MKKIGNKILAFVAAVSLLLGTQGATIVNAASVAPGGGFSASFSCGVYEGSVIASASNATLQSAGNWCDRGGSVSATATAGSSGSASISFTAGDLTNTSSMTEVPAGTYLGGNSVSIVAPSTGGNTSGGGGGGNSSGGGNTTTNTPTEEEKEDTRSKNANLSTLTISEGKLSPDFSADVTEYSVSLVATVTSIKVGATAEDSKSSVSGTGDIEVKPGENKITVTVTAENESTKSYVITATVDEKPLIYMNYNKLKLGVVRNTDAVTAPDGFEKTSIKMNGKDVTAWTNKAMNTTIVYLVDEKTGEKNFYVYDTAKKTVSTVFKPTAILGQNVFIIDVEEDLQKQEGLTYKKVKVDTVELMGWEFNDKTLKNYALIYVMDGNGKKVYYQYEKTQNTLQLYSGAAPVSKATYEDMAKDLDSANLMRNIFIGVSVLLAITTAAGFVLAMKNKKGNVQK